MNPTMAASNSNRLNNDEWECPVGLTPDYAIAIADDSDSDDQDKDNALHGNDNHSNSMINDNGRRHVLLDNNNENIDNDGQCGGSDTVSNNGRNNEGTANDNNIGAGVTVKVSSFFSKQDTTSSNSNEHATIGNGDAIIISASCKVEPQCNNNNNDDDEMNMSNDSAALTLIPQQFENNDEYLVDSSSLLNNKIAGDRDCSTNKTTDTDCRTAQIIASDNNHGTTIGETSNNLPDAANDSTADTTIDQNENPSLQEGQSTNIIDETTNPFASFAFQPSVSTAGSFFANSNSSGGNNNNNNNNKNKSTSSTRRTIKRPRDDSTNTNTNTCQLKSSYISTVMNQRLNNNKKENANPFKLHSYSQKKKKYQSTSAKPSTTTSSSENHNPAESLKECIAKWHSFADPMAPMEQQRFQVLIAARLHVKCHETTVMKAMVRLRGHFQDKRKYGDDGSKHDDVDQGEDFKSETVVEVQQQQHSSTTPQQQQLSSSVQGLTPHTLANSHAETEIAPLLSSILFGNTKARQIVQASQDILSQFGGTVPESMTGLKQITGIGPKLAEILHLVNGRESYL